MLRAIVLVHCFRIIWADFFIGLAMPNFQALPGMKSLRPVTTFDLQTIRQSMQKSFCNGNKRRFEMAEERYKLQKELLQLWYVPRLSYFILVTNLVPSVLWPLGCYYTVGNTS